MRLFHCLVASAAAATLVACGGGSDSISPPITPPASTVTLSIKTGDAQESVPGSALTTNPVVVAKNSTGAPVAGVAITFAIDSGGGSVAITLATTGADGTASPGTWTLGSAEGANVLTISATGATTIKLRSLATFPVTALVSNAAVPRSGAVLTVDAVGNPLNGLTLTIPDTALGVGAQISIGSKASKVTTLPAGFSQVGPTIVITNSVAMSTIPMVLTIPVTVQSPDTALAAFYYDPSSGTYELIPSLARTATTLSVYARHFTSDRLMLRKGSARVAGKNVPSGARVAASYSPVQVIVASVPAASLNAATNTGFTPGIDDWEFVNLGTLPESGGICAGMSISAMYYYYAHRDLGRLFKRFNPAGENNNTNTVGLRFSTVAQRNADWSNADLWFRAIHALPFITGVPAARLHYQTLVMAMRVTQLPQYLAVRGADFSHAVIAFASENGVVAFADPNSPGLRRTMTFTGDAFTPFPFSATAGATAQPVTSVETIGASAMIDAAAIDATWAQVSDSTIGTKLFAQVIPEWRDTLTGSWIDLDTTKTLFTSGQTFVLRTRCLNHACPFVSPQDGNEYINTLLINATGTSQSDSNFLPNGVSTALSEGPTKIGVVQLGDISTSIGASNRRWTNFRWMNVVYGKVAIQPVLPAARPDTTINFSVRSGALAPIIVKYTWDFGDGTAQSTTTTSAAAHAFTVGGDYKVVVKLFDASNRLVGKDSTTASISAQSVSYSVWALNTATFATVNPPMNLDTTQSVVQVLTRKYNALITLWGTPRSAAVTPTLWVVKTPGPFNNRLGPQDVGVYFSDSLPGSNRGLDPNPEPLALAGDVSEFGVDTPEFLPKWSVTGAPPDDGRIVALGALRGTAIFACIGSFTDATFMQAVDFTMKGNTGSGTVTYTFRVVQTGCTKPLVEVTRWQYVVSFTATRIK